MNYLSFLVRRVLALIPVLFGVIVVIFLISHIIPGDPARLLAGPRATDEIVAKIRADYGLDKPLHIQFFIYLKDMVRGDLGQSILTRRPVTKDLLRYFPATFELTTVSVLIASIIGIPLGILAAVYKDRIADHLIRIYSITGISMPVFWLGLLLLLVFYLRLGIAPDPGRISGAAPTHITGLYLVDSVLTGDFRALWSSITHLILPSITLSWYALARIVRMARSSTLEVLDKDYIRTAKAKGLTMGPVLFKHALRNSILPTITVIGLLYGELLGGAVVTEIIFNWPGMAQYMVSSMKTLDYPAVMGVTLIITLAYVVANLLVDLSYGFIDPRVRYD